MIENPFLTPQPLDGPTEDPPQGRGWADDQEPRRFRRRADRFRQHTDRFLQMLRTRAVDELGFDQIPLQPDEQLIEEMSKSTDDLEMEAAVYGPDAVKRRRFEVMQQAVIHGNR